jgi:hypothetical protein
MRIQINAALDAGCWLQAATSRSTATLDDSDAGAPPMEGARESKPGADAKGLPTGVERGSYLLPRSMLDSSNTDRDRSPGAGFRCQCGSSRGASPRLVRQTGMRLVPWILPVIGPVILVALFAATALAQEQGCEVALRDGRVLSVASVGPGSGELWRFTSRDGAATEVAPAELLALHCSGVTLPRLPAAHLAGGEVVRGILVGGNDRGDAFELQSPVLGRVPLRVDRLECLVLQGGDPDALELPDGVDEALFQKAALGFDRLAGVLHQFGDGGIRFQLDGQKEPRWFASRELVGLRLRGAEARKQPAPFELLTRSGDRVGVALEGWRNGRLQIVLEDGRKTALVLGDIGCLSNLGGGAVFVSTLAPTSAAEASPDGDALMPWRRDRAVDGGPLQAGGRAHARGFGVHSRSRLVFTVPAGVARFWTRVGFDDSALALPVRGAVDVRVLVGDDVVFERKNLRAGDPVCSTGLLPVRAGQQLALEVDFGPGRDLGDRVDWLSPVFLPGGRPARE